MSYLNCGAIFHKCSFCYGLLSLLILHQTHVQVMDIQKLAAEMGLSCIATYKLDALKSVNRNVDSCKGTASVCIDANDGVVNNSSNSMNLDNVEPSSVTEVSEVDKTKMQNGKWSLF